MRHISNDLGLCWTTVYDWMEADPEFALRIARAREEGYDAIALDALKIADDGLNDTYMTEDGIERTNTDVIQRSKLRVETRLKLLAKWSPKRYGDKLDVESKGSLTVTVATGIPRNEPDA